MSIWPKRSIVWLTRRCTCFSSLTSDLTLAMDVDARHQVRAMPAGDLLGELAAVGNVGNHHARAFGGERLRIMPPNSLCATRHDCGFTGKPRHDFLRQVMAELVPAIHAFMVDHARHGCPQQVRA